MTIDWPTAIIAAMLGASVGFLASAILGSGKIVDLEMEIERLKSRQ